MHGRTEVSCDRPLRVGAQSVNAGAVRDFSIGYMLNLAVARRERFGVSE
jgi:hypothetical protein